jgi:hypothetical protein
MKVIYFLLFSFLLSFIATEDKCCETCTIEGTKKYYSIDYIFNRCGECCIEPEKYWIYHIFEPGLKEATVENQCYEEGYTVYDVTETHGILGLTVTLDKYKKPE